MHYVQRGNKYNNVRTVVDGYNYASKKEANYAYELDLRKKAKDIKDWQRQVRIPCRVNGRLITTYKMDFVIIHNDDSVEWIEVKGYDKDYVWRLRWKLLEAIAEVEYPHVKMTVVK